MTMGAIAEPLAYPTRRDEAWRYAPHRTLEALTFGTPTTPPRDAGDPGEQLPGLDGPRIVVVNGIVDAGRSQLTEVPGLQLSTLAESIEQASAVTDAHLAVDEPADAFVALNLEYAVDGAVIEVAAGTVLDDPIHVVDIAIPDSPGVASCTGVVIHLGAGSSATVIETRAGDGAMLGGSNIRTTVTLDPGATLEHIVLQDVPAQQVHLSRVDVRQATDSTYRGRSFNIGAAYGRVTCHVALEGAGAVADLSGLFHGIGDQTLDQQITVVHAVADCTSRQAFRGLLDDASTGVFNGGIDVRPGADGTDASQSNDNLLLSNRAEVNTQPRLEILADDVTCTHGATIGQIDDTALYYLRTRGIGADDARRILVHGFSDQVVDDIEIEQVRAWITERLGHASDA